MRWKRTITVVDAHAEGEVGRVVTGGVLPPPGRTLFEQREYLATKDDWLRKFLLNEPRGGGVHSANLIVPPVAAGADVGFIIMEKGGTPYPAMSGSNTICTAAVALATGLVPMTEPETRFTLEVPGGSSPSRRAAETGDANRSASPTCRASSFASITPSRSRALGR